MIGNWALDAYGLNKIYYSSWVMHFDELEFVDCNLALPFYKKLPIIFKCHLAFFAGFGWFFTLPGLKMLNSMKRFER